jgi:hypothetical protein
VRFSRASKLSQNSSWGPSGRDIAAVGNFNKIRIILRGQRMKLLARGGGDWLFSRLSDVYWFARVWPLCKCARGASKSFEFTVQTADRRLHFASAKLTQQTSKKAAVRASSNQLNVRCAPVNTLESRKRARERMKSGSHQTISLRPGLRVLGRRLPRWHRHRHWPYISSPSVCYIDHCGSLIH